MVSCSKQDCSEGTVRFTNNSDDPYDLWIDEKYKNELQGHTFKEYDLLEGEHVAFVQQVSGYLFFPTTKEITLHVYGCEESEWVFP